jgi:hypothetical protein
MAINRNAGFPLDVHQVDWDTGFARQYDSGGADTALNLHDDATFGKCISVFRGFKSVIPGLGLFCHARNLGSSQVTLTVLSADAANGYDATDAQVYLRTRNATNAVGTNALTFAAQTTLVLEAGESADFLIDAEAHIGAGEALAAATHNDYLLFFANEATADFKGTSGELTLASYFGQLIPVSKYDASGAAVTPAAVSWSDS